MTTTTLSSEAKETLRKTVRALRERLLVDLEEAARGEYQLDVTAEKARLPEARRIRRARLEAWIAEQSVPRDRALGRAVKEAAHTLLNRLVLLRILEHHGLSTPPVVTGGLRSSGYATEFLPYAGPLANDDDKGYGRLLGVVFDELALDLPGLYGPVGLTPLFPIPAATLRAVVEALNEPELASAWGDDTTLGWVYQYWNDPEREALDKKIADGKKIEPHEIASKTQMFTERYMVEWLLQNSLGFTWLAICEKNGWKPEAAGVLPELDARRAAWRTKREAGEVALDALMPIAAGLESDWKYYVPQPMPKDAVEKAPASIAEVKLLDPACGSGHFLVIAFGLFARMYEEEARHRGEAMAPTAIARSIVAQNLHGIDIDARAIQIAAAALWLRARLYSKDVRFARMNLVAPRFGLADLKKDDPARVALTSELAAIGVEPATTARLVEALKGVDHLGTLLRVGDEINALVDETGKDLGPLFARGVQKQQLRLEEKIATFLDAHAAESDLGLRLEGEQLAAGLRFIELAKEGRYDVVVGNPPYQGISKTSEFGYVVKNYPRGKADLYAAFLERGLELVREGGISALLTMRGWMFLGKGELRKHITHDHELRLLGDVDRGAFTDVPDEVLATTMSVIRRAHEPESSSIAIQPTPLDDHSRDSGRTARKRAALLAQVGRYEFDPKGFAVIEGEPIVYWWTKEFLARYAAAPKIKDAAPVRQGIATGNDSRFVRRHFEIRRADIAIREPGWSALARTGWFPFLKGAAGKKWFEDLDDVIAWHGDGVQLALSSRSRYGRAPSQYFLPGIAFSMIGADFGARIHRYASIIGHMGSSVYPPSGMLSRTVCSLNTRVDLGIATSLNPGLHFEVGDVGRLPLFEVEGADDIVSRLDEAFAVRERGRESAIEILRPGPSIWRYAQAWAQQAVDRPEGAPLPPYEPEYDPPDPEAHVSFAIGVALGRFGANGEGILDAAPPTALPAGVLFVGPDESYPDSLTQPSLAPLLAAYEAFSPAEKKKPPLRDWLRKEFFAYHKGLYENRPIYFPISSEKKTLVAWVSIHRWDARTLTTLLADHLNPVLRQLDAEIRDANEGRASSEKRAAVLAEQRFTKTKRLRDELAEFIAAVTQIAERGAPIDGPGCPPREVDAPFVMDLDDGVMINSAALWPLLAPQWADPKKWWRQLARAEGKKDYDWAHLAQRYFPARVDAKCKTDPSLAVAHGCFWRYHPAKAFAWELRLQDEIRRGFTIDEEGSDAARAAWVAEHPEEAEAAREKERLRRERKASKAAEAEDAGTAGATEPEEEDEA